MSQRPLRIVIAGGGTGGHVLPAIAVVDEFNRRGTAIDWFWIGSRDGVESGAAKSAGIPFAAVPTGKLRRYVDLHTVTDAVRIPTGVVSAWRLLRWFKPDLVFSTGGFVSVPTVVAAARIAPVLTHEQTTILGLATRIDMRFAHELALSYEATRALTTGFHGRVVVTGNPVRTALANGDRARGLAHWGFDPVRPVLYVTGGARGASPLNTRLEALLPGLLDHCQIVHQTGPRSANGDLDRLRAAQATWPAGVQSRYQAVEFVRDELADTYAAADLVLGRAGAGTVAELAFLGKPSILIPLPLSGGGEQDVNARTMAAAGAAVVIDQESATPDRLRAEITSLLGTPARLATMSSAARTLAHPDAASHLANELLSLAHHK